MLEINLSKYQIMEMFWGTHQGSCTDENMKQYNSFCNILILFW